MPRKPSVNKYLKSKQYPPVFLLYIKQTSRSRDVPHRESFWKKKATAAWEKLAKQPNKRTKWWEKENTMTNVMRCTAGPTWLSKNCTNGANDLQKAKEYYRKHKKKGECLTSEQFEAFGCNKAALGLYKTIREKNYANRTKIQKSIFENNKVEFGVAKKWLFSYRNKLTSKNLKSEDFWYYFDGWLDQAKVFQKVVKSLDENGKYTNAQRQIYENFHIFTEMLDKVMDRFEMDGRKFKNFKLFAQTLPLLRGYPEKNKNAWKKVEEFLKEKSISLKKKGSLSPKTPSRMGVSSTPTKKSSSASIPLNRKKPTPPPKQNPTPKNATLWKSGGAIPPPLPTKPFKDLSDKEKMDYVGSYYLYTKEVFEEMLLKAPTEQAYKSSLTKLSMSLSNWDNLMGRYPNLLDGTHIKDDVENWQRIIMNFEQIQYALGASPGQRERFDNDYVTQRHVFSLLMKSPKSMDLKTAPASKVAGLADVVIGQMNKKK